MPRLICLSPILSIQTFPRSTEELLRVAVAVGEIGGLAEDGTIQIVCTDFFRDLLMEFDWSTSGAVKAEIFRFLTLWFSNGGSRAVSLKVDEWTESAPHPLPASCGEEGGLAELWSIEVGRMLALHDARVGDHEYCIGVACESAFSGGDVGSYCGGAARAFPLVGPDSLEKLLVDAFDYEIPDWVAQVPITVADVAKNAKVLGARRIEAPNGGSHYKVHFGRGRPYVLDPNVDPQPNRFLKEMEPMTSYPLPVIKYALKTGKLPPFLFKLT